MVEISWGRAEGVEERVHAPLSGCDGVVEVVVLPGAIGGSFLLCSLQSIVSSKIVIGQEFSGQVWFEA